MNEEIMNRILIVRHTREHQNCILRTPDWKTKQNGSSECCSKDTPCSHGVRKKKNQQPSIARKLLIFSVDQVGLEPTTSRL